MEKLHQTRTVKISASYVPNTFSTSCVEQEKGSEHGGVVIMARGQNFMEEWAIKTMHGSWYLGQHHCMIHKNSFRGRLKIPLQTIQQMGVYNELNPASLFTQPISRPRSATGAHAGSTRHCQARWWPRSGAFIAAIDRPRSRAPEHRGRATDM